MLKAFLSIIAIAIIVMTFTISGNATLEIGKPAPDFTVTDTNNKVFSLTGHEGKIVVLEWTNHDCPFVRKHYSSGNMQALQKKYTEQGVHWASVVSSAKGKQGNVSAEKANELSASRNASPTHVILDPSGEIGRLFGAKTTPHIFIIDAEGTLVYQGAIDSKPSANPADIPEAKNYISAALDEILAGKPVSEPKTQQYGCSVKY